MGLSSGHCVNRGHRRQVGGRFLPTATGGKQENECQKQGRFHGDNDGIIKVAGIGTKVTQHRGGRPIRDCSRYIVGMDYAGTPRNGCGT